MSRQTSATDSTQPSPLHLQSLPRRVYRFRTLGMGLSLLPIAVVFHEIEAAWPAWAWGIFSCLLWPHIAYQWASRSADPFRTELRNLAIDSAIASSLVPLMHFNLLPSVMLLTVASADKINTGVRGLLMRSLPGMVLGMLVMAAMTGFSIQAATSNDVLLACLPVLIIHTLAVSLSSYQLIRKVQSQNVRLDELSRVDSLTGLESRGYWQEQVTSLLASHLAGTVQASMLLVDVDRFKQINDRHGHATGDDVLRAIAIAIETSLPPGSHAGRIGGDEFAVAVPVDGPSAQAVANSILAKVEALQFARIPPRGCSVSIGIAEPAMDDSSLRAWLEAADHAL
ncbi:MAG: diguanylate cyclase [Thermomonas sp.]